MGMYDNIKCKYPLPDAAAQGVDFQTKDLECTLAEYEITEDGRLIEHCWDYEATPEDELPHKDAPKDSILRICGIIRRVKGSYRIEEQDYDGVLNFYGDAQSGELMMLNFKTGVDELHPGPRPEWFEYDATFVAGKLIKVERVENRRW